MEQICGVIDVQGFQFKSGFVPREMAIVADDFSICVEIDSARDFNELSHADKQTAIYTTKNLNGLHLYPFNDKNYAYVIPCNMLINYIEKIYALISSTEQPYIAVKSNQTLEILKQTNIDYVNLNDQNWNFPKFKDIQFEYGYNYLCGYHKRPIHGSNIIFTCAYRKCAQILRKIREVSADYQIQMDTD